MRGYLYKLTTLLKLSTGLCQKIGQDLAGNRYFQDRYFLFISKRGPKRWVLYKGLAEGSKVAAEWHGWLHYTTNHVPDYKNWPPVSWQKTSLPNLSSISNAYTPLFHKKSEKTSYKPWTPD